MATATFIHTDEEIQKDVLAELKWDAQVQPNEIGVSVRDGVVTLTGWKQSALAQQRNSWSPAWAKCGKGEIESCVGSG
jgi:osmotically-inducible protein OsmY